MTNSVEELEDAACILIIGSNTTVAHPIIATRIFRAREKGAKIIVVDPRKTHIAPTQTSIWRKNRVRTWP